MVTMQQEKANF